MVQARGETTPEGGIDLSLATRGCAWTPRAWTGEDQGTLPIGPLGKGPHEEVAAGCFLAPPNDESMQVLTLKLVSFRSNGSF